MGQVNVHIGKISSKWILDIKCENQKSRAFRRQYKNILMTLKYGNVFKQDRKSTN